MVRRTPRKSVDRVNSKNLMKKAQEARDTMLAELSKGNYNSAASELAGENWTGA